MIKIRNELHSIKQYNIVTPVFIFCQECDLDGQIGESPEPVPTFWASDLKF